MVIIRRNPDGSIASQEGVPQQTQSHPALATKMGMQALQDAGRAVPPLMSEIATKINNAKDKPKKLKVLKEHDSVPLRQVLKGAFDTKRETLLIQILEGLSAEEADFLVTVVNKKVNNKYKGFTANLVKEAFNWDDNFMKKQ